MPNSILWIGLVVLWVFVLFPMLANRHPRIRQHTDAALATRVLHRGDAERRKKGPASGHDTDPDYVPVRRKHHHSDDPEDRMTRSDDSTTAGSDDEDFDTTATTTEVPEPETVSAHNDAVDDAAGESERETAESETDPAPAMADNSTADDPVDETEADEEPLAATAAPRRKRPEPPVRARVPALREPEPEPESPSDDEDFVPSRRGRGGYDPEADAVARKARYSFRQRAVLGGILSTLILAGAGFAIASILWWLCALSGTVLVAYLAYLRRQVRLEEDIRRRRIARHQRSHEESDEDADSSEDDRPRPDLVETRTQLRRAVLVEPDDEDPMFEHLELFDAATARATRQRVAGTRDRRAVGE
ncbi:gephyrin-like molybdotransferase receptor GlpR [Nocardia sp. NPDC020380]|uniref:divisome protein SepX/GlpR n=1 Tax=Nocardia sp. NPDC020380 TaxID=3364309 RepID=UPI00379C9177